jgi:uncharacterized damage-inducible protein DinB
MAISPEVLQDHIDYNAWASLRLLEAAAHLTPEELNRDFLTADHSVLGTLVHIYFADRIWLARVQGAPFPGLPTDSERNLAFLQTAFPELNDRWRQWASSLTVESPNREIKYSDIKGNPWKQPLWQIILHVVNHGTHHRGQISGFLRSMGRTPPSVDLVSYQRVSLK